MLDDELAFYQVSKWGVELSNPHTAHCPCSLEGQGGA
jgi:hypothetical protein